VEGVFWYTLLAFILFLFIRSFVPAPQQVVSLSNLSSVFSLLNRIKELAA